MRHNDPATSTEMNADDTTKETDALGAAAHTAVGVLTEMQKRDTYYARDVDEAIDELEAGLETPGVAETPTGKRAADAVRHLKELEAAAPDERAFLIRETLADLAPVAADVADHSSYVARAQRPQRGSEKPTVPAFYHVPEAAADRAIERFNRSWEMNPNPERRAWLAEYIYDEIQENHIIFVDDEPLAEYASGRVESLTIETDGE